MTSGRRNPQAVATTPGLRILHLEDSATDQELVRNILKKAGVVCTFTYAADESAFQAALRQDAFDLILSDFTLPGYGGSSALAYAHARHPEIPYVFVSGTIGEERAIESVRNGAADYVLKDRLDRLLPAVRRALAEAEERTRRRVAEEALRQSEERFREMAENVRDVFSITSPDGRQLFYVSPAYAHIWGKSVAELYAQPNQWIDAIEAEDQPRMQAALAEVTGGKECRVEYRVHRPDRTTRWVEDRRYPVRARVGQVERAVGVVTDITARRQLEAQLQQAQKMEAIGQLAGGIAHDFNNILTVINSHANLLLHGGGLAPPAAESLKFIYAAGERAASLTRQLLVFSRQQAVRRQAIDLNKTVDDAARLLGRLIGEDIKLDLRLAPGPLTVNADTGMMEQVLMNLAVNARDAMPKGGRLTITTSLAKFDQAETVREAGPRPGEFACVNVRDTGCGIPPEIQARIFEPFFTTKAVGAGTGLGLATVFGIVREHDGWLEVESEVDRGSCFKIFLPLTAEPIVAPAKMPEQWMIPGGGETILLVEDETLVRELAVAVLQRLGYRVLQAASGKQALEVWKLHGSMVALLFTDLVMPDGLTGVDLAKELLAQKPGLKVIFTSGYARKMTAQVFSLLREMPFLQKPYVPATLAGIVREALNKTDESSAVSSAEPA